MKIVSLLPSATEILFAVGAGEDVVGVTFECDFPPEARTRQIVSTTALGSGLTPAQIDVEVRARVAAGEDLYTLDEGALRDLDPDVVVTQDLCAVCAVDVANVDQALDHLGCRAEIITLDPMTLDEVLESILTLGALTANDHRAAVLVSLLQDRLHQVSTLVAHRRRPRIAVLEWTDPPFSAGHWVPDMVTAAGATCGLGDAGQRSRPIDWADLTNSAPDVIVVAPCGFGFAGAAELAATLRGTGRLPSAVPLWAVDADAAFVRPGPRLVDGVEALAAISHPEIATARPELATRIDESSTDQRTPSTGGRRSRANGAQRTSGRASLDLWPERHRFVAAELVGHEQRGGLQQVLGQLRIEIRRPARRLRQISTMSKGVARRQAHVDRTRELALRQLDDLVLRVGSGAFQFVAS